MARSESFGWFDAAAAPRGFTKVQYDLDQLRMRTRFVKENAAEVDEAARGEMGRATAVHLYWRLTCLASITEATVRDLAECEMVTTEQAKRLDRVRDHLSDAEDLLRECYDAEQAGTCPAS